MRGKSHCTIGILTSIQTCIFFNIPISIFTLIISAFFSLLPDLDETNSTISSFFMLKKFSNKSLKSIVYTLIFIIFIISVNISSSLFICFLLMVFFVIFIESKFSKTHLKKFFVSFIFILISTLLYLITSNIYLSTFFLLISTFPWLKHRGFSHSILAILSIYFLLKNIEIEFNINYISILGTISYSSHIFLGDIFTKNGVPIFYPLTQKKISLSPYTVGSYWCNFLEYIFIFMLILLIFYTI